MKQTLKKTTDLVNHKFFAFGELWPRQLQATPPTEQLVMQLGLLLTLLLFTLWPSLWLARGRERGWGEGSFSKDIFIGIEQDFELFFFCINVFFFHLKNFEKGSIFFINNWKCLVKTCICIQLVFNIFSCFESFICWTDGPVVEIKRYMINDYNGALEEFWGNLLVVWTVDVTSHPEWGGGQAICLAGGGQQ